MAGRKKKSTHGITSDLIREMLTGHGASETYEVLKDSKKAEALISQALNPNGRGGERLSDQMDFKFSATGRFDSFTLACNGLEQAEALYGFPFRAATDHLFLYTRLSPEELTVHDGYALFIKDKRMFYFAAHRDEDGRFRAGNVFAVVPEGLLDYLNGANGVLKDNTVSEQMCWVREAQKHGLLALEYPEFIIGLADQGRGKWLALRTGSLMPKGFLRRFD